jgi:hypothetical protein
LVLDAKSGKTLPDKEIIFAKRWQTFVRTGLSRHSLSDGGSSEQKSAVVCVNLRLIQTLKKTNFGKRTHQNRCRKPQSPP